MTKTSKRGVFLIILILIIYYPITGLTKEFEIKGRELTFNNPSFSIRLPSELYLIHSFAQDFPSENSRTRAYIFIKDRNKEAEELLIIQIADRTNPQAGPITASPLKPYSEKRMYAKGKELKDGVEISYMIQLMAWNPDAPSLKPVLNKGVNIAHKWALQGQFLFIYQGDHAVSFRYSKSIDSFGMKISEDGKDWEKDRLKGNEKKVYEKFKNTFMEMLRTINIKSQ